MLFGYFDQFTVFCAGMIDTPSPEIQKCSFIRKTSLLWLIILLACIGLIVFGEDMAVMKKTHSLEIGGISSDHNATSESNDSARFPTAQMMNIILFWTFSYYSKPMNLDKQDIATFECGEYKCGFTKNRHHLQKSHVVIFNPTYSKYLDLPKWRESWQRWALQVRESPINVLFHPYFDNKINWTITYHHDSDISLVWGFHVPEGKYDQGPFYLPDNQRQSLQHSRILSDDEDVRSILAKKTHTALWIASNCGVSERNNYIKEMRKGGIQIDVFGDCGQIDPCKRNLSCVNELFSKYKFYIAFENSHCEDYITEKLWKALYGNILPIVMGSTIENYKKLLPPNSFLHVNNFTNVQHLVQYIQFLDSNNNAHERYHYWRKRYEVVPLIPDTSNNVNLWVCDLCKKINDLSRPAYKSISSMWSSKKMCHK